MSDLDVNVLRESISKVTKILSGRGINVTQRGSSAYVESNSKGEPVRVNLPYIPDSASIELVNAINGFLDHEVGHLMFSDFKILGKAARANKAVGMLTNIIEDPFVEKQMQKRFRGSESNLENVANFFLEKYTTPKLEGAIVAGDAKEIQSLLTVPAIRAWSGQPVFEKYMADKWPLIEEFTSKLPVELIERLKTVSSTQDSFEIATEIHRIMTKDSPPSSDDSDEKESKKDGGRKGRSDESKGKKGDDDEGEESTKPKPKPKDDEDKDEDDDDDGKGGGDPKDKDDGKDKSKDDKGGSDDEKDEDDGGDEEPESDEGEDGDDEEPEPEEDEPEEDEREDGGSGDGEESGGDRGLKSLPEEGEKDEEGPEVIEREFEGMLGRDFDDAAGEVISKSALNELTHEPYVVFTKDYDIIEAPKEVSAYQDYMLEALEESVRKVVGPLQKNLERLILAQEKSRWEPGLRRGKINASSLYKLKTGDDRVFRRRQYIGQSKNVAVTLLVDLSGSMASGGRITSATQATYALAQTLARLGVTYEVLGFTTKPAKYSSADRMQMKSELKSMGRASFSRSEVIYMPVFKSFAEPFKTEQRKRIAIANNSIRLSNNVDGESVEYAAMRLLKQSAERRVMFVLSDGEPLAAGNRREQAIHLKNVVEKFTKIGIDMVGIGIQTDAVKRFYPDSVVLERVSQLPLVIMDQLRKVLI